MQSVILHAESGFHKHENNFDFYAWEYDTHECDNDTLENDVYTQNAIPYAECDFNTQCAFDMHECDSDTHDCDFNTQSVSLALTIWFWSLFLNPTMHDISDFFFIKNKLLCSSFFDLTFTIVRKSKSLKNTFRQCPKIWSFSFSVKKIIEICC
jgi:hypothetical protein